MNTLVIRTFARMAVVDVLAGILEGFWSVLNSIGSLLEEPCHNAVQLHKRVAYRVPSLEDIQKSPHRRTPTICCSNEAQPEYVHNQQS